MSGTNNSAASAISSVQAMSTSTFMSKVGMASHLDALGTGNSYNYGNLVADMRYLGVSLIRSGADMDFDGGGGQVYADEVELGMAAGIRFDLVINSDSADPGGIASIEGMNEVHPANLATAAAYMSSLSAAVTADPLLPAIPILNYSILS